MPDIIKADSKGTPAPECNRGRATGQQGHSLRRMHHCPAAWAPFCLVWPMPQSNHARLATVALLAVLQLETPTHLEMAAFTHKSGNPQTCHPRMSLMCNRLESAQSTVTRQWSAPLVNSQTCNQRAEAARGEHRSGAWLGRTGDHRLGASMHMLRVHSKRCSMQRCLKPSRQQERKRAAPEVLMEQLMWQPSETPRPGGHRRWPGARRALKDCLLACMHGACRVTGSPHQDESSPQPGDRCAATSQPTSLRYRHRAGKAAQLRCRKACKGGERAHLLGLRASRDADLTSD